MKMRDKTTWLHKVPPSVLIVVSFAAVILIGALLLMLPISSKTGMSTGFTDSLFTSVSATCVTGLVVKDTYNYWSVFGQCVILTMIQIGGLGLVTLTMFIGSFVKRRFGLKDLALAQETVNYNSVPEVKLILRMVVVFSFTVEAIGAGVLMPSFIARYGTRGIFTAVFVSVSAYCNAGFDLMGSDGHFVSLIPFQDDPVVLITVMALIVIGGLGVLVWYDLIGAVKRKSVMLHSKVVFFVTLLLVVGGATCIFLSEYYNPDTIGQMNTGGKILNSFFQSVTARTAGFSSIPLADMYMRTKLVMVVLMFIGGAPGSTAGGIKVTTFWVLLMTVASYLCGRSETVIARKKVNPEIVSRAFTIAVLMAAVTLCCAGVIYTVESPLMELSVGDALFEAVSAAATVGVSSDLTPYLQATSKVALMITMFIGRVGIVSFVLAITTSRRRINAAEILPEGKIIVG